MKTRLKAIFAAAFLLAAPAFADEASEKYVQKNASEALSSLNAEGLTSSERRQKFQTLMNRFTDMDKVSNFVIGVYSRRFSASDLKDYQAAYREYALATYEAELDKYRGNEIVVTGSTDRNDSDSVVDSVVKRPNGDLPVKWRVLKTKDAKPGEEPYQVVDVGLEIDGNLLWLALEQRAQFLALLDRSNGNADTLIAKIGEMTTRLQAEAAQQQTALTGSETSAVSQAG